MTTFKYFPLELIQPDYASPLTDVIIELEKLRYKRLGGEVHPEIFFQLKDIFQLLESIESVRIEGNNTTISEVVDSIIENKTNKDDKLKQIFNNKKAIEFIEKKIKLEEDFKIDKLLVCELHQIVVNELLIDGDPNPGIYRKTPVKINHSTHLPPTYHVVEEYMEDLLEFINRDVEPKYQLLVTALAHHRFVWIHPFQNGNGRVVRLLTYLMIRKQKFSVKNILNPTAIFCNDRNLYYCKLQAADSGEKENLLDWCNYVLTNLLREIHKIDNLMDANFLKTKILFPALNYSMERKHITEEEYKVLKLAYEQGEIKASDINRILGKKYQSEVSRFIKKLKDKEMLMPVLGRQRIYVPQFFNNYLLRGVIDSLEKNNFVPFKD